LKVQTVEKLIARNSIYCLTNLVCIIRLLLNKGALQVNIERTARIIEEDAAF